MTHIAIQEQLDGKTADRMKKVSHGNTGDPNNKDSSRGVAFANSRERKMR